MTDATGFDLGPLEADVMRVVWEKGEVQVEDVHRALLADRQIAYTTVMTVMTRLVRKGLLTRQRCGRAYLYRAARGREEMAASTLQEWSQRFFGGRVLPAVSFLLGTEKLSPDEIAAVRRLLERLEEGDER
ncbi:MAG: BlaI/MecI/CopY family transcriptional regulator [Symbiobacterium sp.]|uniref:BlaI/MecI/CopY family transcriptional regulator n=1 Tax=Symbiobacterium sp. TaxID=1971213 RepID=UPI0034646B84